MCIARRWTAVGRHRCLFAGKLLSILCNVLVVEQRVEELEGELKQKDSELLKRDRVITDLRVRLPASSDRDAVFEKVASQSALKSPRDEDYASSKAVRVATSTVSSLQVHFTCYPKQRTVTPFSPQHISSCVLAWCTPATSWQGGEGAIAPPKF